MAVIFKGLERLAAYAARDAVADAARDLATQAEATLATHRRTGNASISVTQGRLDAFVNLDDPAALSIEVGHYTWPGRADSAAMAVTGRRYVPGLHVLGRLL